MISVDEAIIQETAKLEGVEVSDLSDNVRSGRTVILYNNIKPLAIGAGVSTKTNANIGIKLDKKGDKPLSKMIDEAIETELRKLDVAVNAGVDTVMDLSNGQGITEIRQALLDNSTVHLGTVPLYEIAMNLVNSGKDITKMKPYDFLTVIEAQAMQGVRYMTLHCAILEEGTKLAETRIGGIVSRGGHLIETWMQENKKENPLYTHFNDILALLKQYNVVLSIGDGLRPGATADASDEAQLHELNVAAELVQKVHDYGVQVIVEGPGHVPLREIEETMKQEKDICHGAPFYILGPLPIDNGAGYDHIVAGIGAALAARDEEYGADFLCYVPRSEHLHSPTVEDVKQGAIAIVKAAEAADKGLDITGIIDAFCEIEDRNIVTAIYNQAGLLSSRDIHATLRNNGISQARRALIWSVQPKYALFKDTVARAITEYNLKDGDPCTMCGDQCPLLRNEHHRI